MRSNKTGERGASAPCWKYPQAYATRLSSPKSCRSPEVLSVCSQNVLTKLLSGEPDPWDFEIPRDLPVVSLVRSIISYLSQRDSKEGVPDSELPL